MLQMWSASKPAAVLVSSWKTPLSYSSHLQWQQIWCQFHVQCFQFWDPSHIRTEAGYLITRSGTWFLFQLLTKISPGFLADYIWSISARDKQSCGSPTSIHPYDVAIVMWLTCLSVHIWTACRKDSQSMCTWMFSWTWTLWLVFDLHPIWLSDCPRSGAVVWV
jgi:hypothetical protein